MDRNAHPSPNRREFLATLASTATVSIAGGWTQPKTGIASVDCTTLTNKVICGYQGWFNAQGDGAGRGFNHWSRRAAKPAPGNATFDLWPELSEYTAEERFATAFQLPDGRLAEVFSSYLEPTVDRHVRWAREYGIDGLFAQRFINSLRRPENLGHNDRVLDHLRKAVGRYERCFALMYDLSGSPAGVADRVRDDWQRLRTETKLIEDPRYLHHQGRPVLGLWGIGFGNGRAYTLRECLELMIHLQSDAGGRCAIVAGVPTYWREGIRDAMADPLLQQVLSRCEVISPWTIGRYRTPESARRYAERTLSGDLAWAQDRGLDVMPVTFPGFSWHNLKGDPLNAIPRLQGGFFWEQACQSVIAGAKMIYVAMFDEVDEGTAIFKCASEVPPPGDSAFLAIDDVPNDRYLKLTGATGSMLRGQLSPKTRFSQVIENQ